MTNSRVKYNTENPEEILLLREDINTIMNGGFIFVNGIKIRMIKRNEMKISIIETHGKFKRMINEIFKGNNVFLITDIITDGEHVSYHNYRVGSKIFKDYNDKCPKGHYKIKVIEY